MTFTNALEIVSYSQGIGIHLAIENDQLRVDAPKGVLSSVLKECLVKHKFQILEILKYYGYTVAELKQAAGIYWEEIQQKEAAISALAEMLSEQALLKVGKIPERFSAWTYCKACAKQVPVPPTVVNGGQVLACMHCFYRKREIH